MAVKLNIPTVMSTVEKNNIASKVVHEKCEGVLINENSERWFFSFDDVMRKMKENNNA